MTSSAVMSSDAPAVVDANPGTNTGASARKLERCCDSEVPVLARLL